jgi:hypothetical protein
MRLDALLRVRAPDLAILEIRSEARLTSSGGEYGELTDLTHYAADSW